MEPFTKLIVCMGLAAAMTGAGFAAGKKHDTNTRSDEGGTISLDRAIRLALVNNAELRASAARKEAAAGRSLQSRAWPNPELELSSEDMPVNRSRMTRSKQMIGISQTFPYPGKRQADRQIGAADASVGAATWRLSRAEMARAVKIAYCQVQVAERAEVVADDLVKLAEAASQAASKRKEAGEITLQEQLRSDIQLDQAKDDRVGLARETSLARLTLAHLIGRPDLRTARLLGSPDESTDITRVRGTPSAWLAGHPSMVAAYARRAQAEATARRADLESRPDFKVGVAGGRDEATRENLMELRLSVPLPIFDRSQGKLQEAHAGVREADAELEGTRQRLISDWLAAGDRFRTAASQVQRHRDHILPKCEEAMRLVQSGFNEGKFGFLDLADTQRTAAEARMTYQKKIFELNVARADLESFTDPVVTR